MTNLTPLTQLIECLEKARDYMISQAADAITDGEWESAVDLSNTARMLTRQICFRRDELNDLLADRL